MSADGYTLPTSGPVDLSTVTILAGGNEIDLTIHLVSVVVTHEVNRIPVAKLVFADGDVSKQTFEVSNLDTFKPGTEIEIQSGYHNTEDPLFKGIVVRHGLKTRSDGPSLLTVVCKDAAVRMTIARTSGYFYDSTDSDVIEELIGRHKGLSTHVTATKATHENIVQYQVSDWDMMLMRAEVMGMLVFTSSGKVTVKPPDPGQQSKQPFIYGATILNFEAEMDAEAQLEATSAAGWDQSAQALVETDGADPGFPEQGNVSAKDLLSATAPKTFHMHHSGNITEKELQAWSDTLLMRSRLAKIRGRLTCQGFVGVEVGDVIDLSDVGERFDGNCFISAIRHDITQGNWLMHIQLGLDPKLFSATRDIAAPSAGGLLPGIEGLHIGVVTAIEGDPNDDGRIRVRVPTIDSGEEGIWTRIATLDAGAGRGTVFRPEVNDEVIVGFLYGDPRQAVMLGQMHSSAHAPPIAPSNDNHEKAYVSRAETELWFNDENPSVHIKLKSGRIAVLDDKEGEIRLEDPDGNKVVMKSSGITLDSPADITIKAGGNITVEAGGDIKAKGVNIEAKASAEVKAEGGAGAALKSGGTTTVKGATVMIN